jgi:hypothetical protein
MVFNSAVTMFDSSHTVPQRDESLNIIWMWAL